MYRTGRANLIAQLGGVCVDCGEGDERRLEFDHLEPRTWDAEKTSRLQQLRHYRREAEAGLIAIRCRTCNAVKGEPMPTTNVSSATVNVNAGSGALFPLPIEVLGVTGDFNSGKTVFGLTIAPGKATLHIDTEKSGASFLKLGHERVDLPARLLQAYPNGHRPIDTYLYLKSYFGTITPGKFRVIFLDAAEDFETGLADWVMENAHVFGRTKGFYLKWTGIYWGDVKATLEGLLTDLASRCETFAFSTHLAREFNAGGATGRMKPKGKESLLKLASLYLWLERPKAADGSRDGPPAARVLKERLADFDFDPVTGELKAVRQLLPPRLPIATPAALRKYLAAPIGDRELTADEKAPEERLSDDDRAAVRHATALAEADAARANLERAQLERNAAPAPTTDAGGVGVPRQIGDEPNDTPTSVVNGSPAKLAGIPQADCVQLWEEYALLNGWGAEEKFRQLAGVFAHLGTASFAATPEAKLVELRMVLLDKVGSLYEARGMGGARPPF